MRGKSKKIATKGFIVRGQPVHQLFPDKHMEYEVKYYEDFDMFNTDRDIVKEYINFKKGVEVPRPMLRDGMMDAIWMSSSPSYYCGDCMQSAMM